MSNDCIYCGDCLDALRIKVSDSSVNLILTSPPYANQRRDNYGGIKTSEYVGWFLKRAEEFKRVLTLNGSLVINICPHTEKGEESRYVRDLIDALQETWYLLDTYCSRKTTAVPGKPVRRLKNAWEPIFHFSLSLDAAFYPNQVMKPASASSIKRAQALRGRDLTRHKQSNGSGLTYSMLSSTRRFRSTGSGFSFIEANCNGTPDGLVYPDNVIECAPETRNLHTLYGHANEKCMASAVFPKKIPSFFIDLLTKPGDVVMDPFAGSGTTAKASLEKGRRFIAIDKQMSNCHLMLNRLKGAKS